MAERYDSSALSERHHRPGNPRMLLVALLLLVGVPTLVFLFLAPAQNEQAANVDTFTTAVAEQRALRLDDGSELRLQENSSVAVRYSAEQRRVQLLQGEVLFIIAPETSRPFWAQAGTLRLRADASAFALQMGDGVIRLEVLEGSVRAQSGGGVQTLNAGERVELALNH
ncbi:MAG: FecR domain-containing protein [Saccharospirillaceae bacterium]|nr:FecR domain-containing protein [Saccharospirillaceae bacterium]MCD8532872.1 FecR domain-containing protein [Saccharospirillaceae bacterium]